MALSLRRCHEILGIEPGASDTEIRQSWRDLVKVWHPDRFEGDPRLAAKAAEMLKAINEAYDTLTRAAPPAAETSGATVDPLVDFLNELRRR